MSVREDEQFQHLDVFQKEAFLIQLLGQTGVDVVCKLGQNIVDWFWLIAFGLPSIKEGLKDSFVVKGHGSEASPLKVEVKVHVVLLFVYL